MSRGQSILSSDDDRTVIDGFAPYSKRRKGVYPPNRSACQEGVRPFSRARRKVAHELGLREEVEGQASCDPLLPRLRRMGVAMQTLGFDLDRFIRTSARVDLSDVEWDRARDPGLTPAEVRTLQYMMDIESHTVIFLRDLLATHAALDPEVTAFLCCWNFEELWHGEAFSRLLGEAGIDVAPDREPVKRDSPSPSRRIRNHWIRRRLGAKGYVSHLGTLLGSALAHDDFVAIHMTWGAVNELTTLTAYHRMIEMTDNVPLVQILHAVIKQERRHFAFYRAQARLRLEKSP